MNRGTWYESERNNEKRTVRVTEQAEASGILRIELSGKFIFCRGWVIGRDIWRS